MPLDVTELRRDLHRHPETAFREIRTCARIAAELTALGVEPRLGREVIRVDEVVDYPSEEQLDESAERAERTGA